MGLFEWAKNQFIEIIEWVDDGRSTLVHRFPVYRKEIKNGAQLTVREGQAAILVNEGQIADVFGPGMHQLTTRNLPILSTLQGWKHGFESPFKAEVYFVSTRLFTDCKWGTANPIMLRDADFGVLRLRAFGTYAMQIDDPGAFLKQHVGTTGTVTVDHIIEHLRNQVTARFADSLGESGIPALDLASNYDELAALLQKNLNTLFDEQGVNLVNLTIENISLPPEVERALDQRSQMAVLGDMNRYQQFKTAEATTIAAGNEGMGGAGMAMGAGFAMGHGLMQQMQAPQRGAPAPDNFSTPTGPSVAPTASPTASPTAAPPATALAPAATPATDSPETKLQKVANLLSAGLITEDEAKAHRARILESMF